MIKSSNDCVSFNGCAQIYAIDFDVFSSSKFPNKSNYDRPTDRTKTVDTLWATLHSSTFDIALLISQTYHHSYVPNRHIGPLPWSAWRTRRPISFVCTSPQCVVNARGKRRGKRKGRGEWCVSVWPRGRGSGM